MRKYTLIGIIVLMSISLLGVVGIQLYWINNAIKVKQQLFERNVHDALANVVDKLETREAVSVVTNQIASLKADTLPSVTVLDSITATKVTEQPVAIKSSEIPVSKAAKAITKGKIKAPHAASPGKRATTTFKAADIFKPSRTGTATRTQNWQVTYTDSLYRLPELKALSKLKAASFSTDTFRISNQPTVFFSAVPDTITLRKLRNAQPLQERAIHYTDATAAQLNNRIFRISADTLRHVAFTIDSLQLAEISSVNVKNDSVYIYRRGSVKPVYVYSQAKPFKFSSGAVAGSNPKITLRNTKPSGANKTKTISPKAAQAISSKETSASIKKDAVQKIEVKKDKLNDVVQKMMVEYVVRDVPLKDRLNTANLQALLQDELKEKGIDLAYGYHVVTGEQDTIAVKQAGQTDKNTKYFAAPLFPNDIIEKPDYLAVYFPDTEHLAIRSLAGMMTLSGLFTLIIIATFATTIHIIYKQKRLSEMKNDFINNMTHEFKTPIATISLATDSIFNPKVYEHPEKIKYYTSIIKEENKRMNAQVENVLQIALLEKNEFKLNLQPVDVHILILKAIESIKLQVEQRLGQISINLNASYHELQSDEIHLFNVICNLLDNANKYSPATPEIEITTQNVEGGLQIAVHDNGMGMSKDAQQHVFEKFYRVPTGNLHNVKGFGLGLSYVKAIVQAHDGYINLWSEPGKGSRFEIFLPFKG